MKLRRTPNSLKVMVTEFVPDPDCTTGYGYSPPARKLASLPLVAIRFGSARLWKRPLFDSALHDGAEVFLGVEDEEVQEVAEDELASSNVGAGVPAVACGRTTDRSPPEPLAKNDTPSSCIAERLTSAKRTRSMTWFDATPSCCFSMLTTSSFFST